MWGCKREPPKIPSGPRQLGNDDEDGFVPLVVDNTEESLELVVAEVAEPTVRVRDGELLGVTIAQNNSFEQKILPRSASFKGFSSVAVCQSRSVMSNTPIQSELIKSTDGIFGGLRLHQIGRAHV